MNWISICLDHCIMLSCCVHVILHGMLEFLDVASNTAQKLLLFDFKIDSSEWKYCMRDKFHRALFLLVLVRS